MADHQIGTTDKGDRVLIVAEDDTDYLRAVQYVKLRELTRKTPLEDIAATFNVHPQTLQRWIQAWTMSGLLARVRKAIFATIVAEEIHVASDMVAREWLNIVARQVQTATVGRSDKNALDAATWLHTTFVQPRMDELEADDSAEMAYISQISGEYDFNPLSIGDAEFSEDA